MKSGKTDTILGQHSHKVANTSSLHIPMYSVYSSHLDAFSSAICLSTSWAWFWPLFHDKIFPWLGKTPDSSRFCRQVVTLRITHHKQVVASISSVRNDKFCYCMLQPNCKFICRKKLRYIKTAITNETLPEENNTVLHAESSSTQRKTKLIFNK